MLLQYLLPDTNDGKVHFTAANLNNKFHRSLEPNTTTRLLKAMFSNEQYFAHHTHLPEQGFLVMKVQQTILVYATVTVKQV